MGVAQGGPPGETAAGSGAAATGQLKTHESE